ncbi:glucosaminidase domain-containing protein [Ferruginibacter lapsinanis]|uniref:glucosaminidase domain-containing protein n=1 Tax=Ferruginibacter lapsinanis TaxID=563172 RepID=UPI001E39FFC0|nr:glucosaminidase domain-containing protein [Ferruginibacter lapsinanis]UEG51271.1 glucosaminidase domain-containing protein [Ferruginibacter lapsinanis]
MVNKQSLLNAAMRRSLRVAFTFVVLVTISGYAFSQTKYIKQYRSVADSLGKVYGIPAAVILGVAIIESSAGTSKNCRLLNNHFGIVGKNHMLKSKGIRTRYKYYPSGTASYIGFCELLSKRKFYPKLKKNLNYNLWVDAISKSGYSEVPSVWKQRVLSTIKKHRL